MIGVAVESLTDAQAAKVRETVSASLNGHRE
jgi:hypothetical protein